MKILAIRLAKSIWLFPTVFLNPKGKYILADIGAIKDRYSFLKSPLDGKVIPDKEEGYKFESGVFTGSSGQIAITQLAIHADGIVVETRSSTDDGDLFLSDLLSWAASELSFAQVAELPINRIYSNEMNFTLLKRPEFLNPALSAFYGAANECIGRDFLGGSDFLTLSLGTDAARNRTQQTFTIAREINTRIDDNRYYSFASTTTKNHIAILEKIERLEK